MPDLSSPGILEGPPRSGDWVASRAAVKRRGRERAAKWHVGDVRGETMQIHNHRYGLKRVKVSEWVVVYRPGDKLSHEVSL